ncbi:hypothetical protein [Anaerosalibacter massiliensis]|uniref:hypothetical protein n=1 Tax=Anaerosalibacter massiliensis TaxID=1347392 RepID=UPI0005B2A0CB|nr:hypothetical protein [Anaerosalibacter massiliensis]
MTNMQRLEMEIKDINIEDDEREVKLKENGLEWSDTYNAESKSNLKAIYKTAVSILESIANNPQTMKNYKTDDISITHFHTNIMQRIDYLNRKIRMMADDNDFGEDGGATIGYLFTE